MNCVHASAGPIEGLKEKLLWRRKTVQLHPPTAASSSHSPSFRWFHDFHKHEFGLRLIHEGGIEPSVVYHWLKENPLMKNKDGEV